MEKGQVPQKDPYGKDPKQLGAKLDAGKSPVWQGLLDYFPRACKEVAFISAGGAVKYAWKGWEHVPDGINRYRNAQGRHIFDESIQGVRDPEGFRHLAQNVWNGLAALELTLREEEQRELQVAQQKAQLDYQIIKQDVIESYRNVGLSGKSVL